MCGIVGLLSRSGRPAAIVRAMAGALVHRGPDGEGEWRDPEAGVALGHRRLAIIDLSPQGAQPMASRCGRFVITFNGEIYNYRALRRELDEASGGVPWRSQSDTEVLLEAVSRWGFEPALKRLEGQFAFGLWDRAERRLRLARDRFGEKPLYWGWAGGDFVFGSELKALRRHPAFDPAWDPEAISAYVRYGYVPQPLSIHRSIRKLAPGGWLSLRLDEAPEHGRFWSAAEEAAAARAAPFQGSAAEAAEEAERLIREAVGASMVADVPLGALLSGGVDSSTVVALMQAQSARAVKTFTIGTRDRGLDEAAHAKAIAGMLGTDHTELYVEPGDALAVIPRLPSIYDEPFADASQIPTYLVSALARREVTVALSGDGGDELFGGYNRHVYGARWRRLRRVPRPLRSAAAAALLGPSPALWSALLSRTPGLPAELRHGRPGEKIHKAADKLAARSGAELFEKLRSRWARPSEVLRRAAEDPAPAPEGPFDPEGEFVERSMLLDTLQYLPDDVLVKVDRASMATSLEVRAPLLNAQIFRFAWSLPTRLKVDRGRGKLVLRDVLARHVPPAMFERPKQGFAVPVDDWLRGDLRAWGEELLGDAALADTGVFEPAAVRRVWNEHQSGARNNETRLWTLLMFQAWARSEEETPRSASSAAYSASSAAT